MICDHYRLVHLFQTQFCPYDQCILRCKLKDLYFNDLFERKYIIEYMEAELTGSLRNTSNNDNYAMTEEININGTLTTEGKSRNDTEIDLKEEQKTQAYK